MNQPCRDACATVVLPLVHKMRHTSALWSKLADKALPQLFSSGQQIQHFTSESTSNGPRGDV
eukprot:4409427-Amphidinium_carterae.1